MNLSEGLEEIGRNAFCECTSLQEIRIPPAIKAIKHGAFVGCSRLSVMSLNEGLQEIGVAAFFRCTSLREVVIPSTIKAIKNWTFHRCTQLTFVNLSEGLEKIGKEAFCECTSLQRLVIPPTVTEIHDTAFRGCSSLTRVMFCDEIEEFVATESMRDWWSHGVHEKSLRMYCFLVQRSIPQRLGRVRPRTWQSNIHGMLSQIPTISKKGLKTYLDFIDSRLSVYEDLEDAPMFLELALWKSNTIEQIFDRKNDSLTVGTLKKQCRIDSLSMVAIIVPNVLSFLTDGNGVIEYGDGNSDDDDNSSDESSEDYDDDSSDESSEDYDDDSSNERSEDDDDSSDEDNVMVVDDDDL